MEHWPVVSHMFTALPARCRIRHITFCLHVKLSRPIGGGAWNEVQPVAIEDDGLELLETSMQGEKFGELKSVRFLVVGFTGRTKSEVADAEARIREVLQQTLPSIFSKDVVTVRLNWYVRIHAVRSVLTCLQPYQRPKCVRNRNNLRWWGPVLTCDSPDLEGCVGRSLQHVRT